MHEKIRLSASRKKQQRHNKILFALFVFFAFVPASLSFIDLHHPPDTPLFFPWPLITALSLLLSVSVFILSRASVSRLSRFKKVLFSCAILLLAFATITSLIVMGLPALYSKYFGQPFQLDTHITQKSDHYQRRDCDVRVYVSDFIQRICVNDDFYQAITVGDAVHIQGRKTQYGYHLMQIEKKVP